MGYRKGSRRENELGEIFAEHGFAWIRAPGSGTADRELPDLLLGKDGRSIAIEVKSAQKDDKYIYISKQEVEDLIYFAENFGAEYYVAFRFDYDSWMFVRKEEMKETSKNYRCDRDLSSEAIGNVCQ